MAKKSRGVEINIDDRDVLTLFRALGSVNADLRKNTNARLREAAKECAGTLAMMLKANVVASPAPQTRLVAATARVKSDRTPVVIVGGTKKVGRAYKSRKGGKVRAPAGQLLWGVEYGDKDSRFASRNESGYWIKPTTKLFMQSKAPGTYYKAVVEILKDSGVL
tara:strand:+ start:3368 stop:3859 length:492 start_codon:yes stop_codon:yes gene_type:complete